MRETINRLLAHLTAQEDKALQDAFRPGRPARSRKAIKFDAETDDVSYDKLFDED